MQKIEFGIAFVIFMFSFSFVVHSLLSTEYGMDESQEGEILLETFIKSKGSPEDWESNPAGVEEIGLASSPNVLHRGKVEELMKINYKDVKEMLGTTVDFRVVIESESYRFTYGKILPRDKGVKKYERPILLDNELGKFWLYVW